MADANCVSCIQSGTPAKPSNPYDGGNYRPVVVCSRLLACLDVIVNNRLMEYCLENKLISDEQYRFIRGRRCEQAIASLSFIREIRQMTGRTRAERRTYCALIDMRRAFDTTWRARLWVRLHEKGITGAVWLYLQRSNLVDYLRTVQIPGVATDEWYSDGLGCAQGVILSPLMFDFEFNETCLPALSRSAIPVPVSTLVTAGVSLASCLPTTDCYSQKWRRDYMQ